MSLVCHLEERYARGRDFAYQIAGDYLPKPKTYGQAFQIPNSKWLIDIEVVNKILEMGDECLVYSFGISDRDDFTEFLAEKGCIVHGFDPTRLPKKSLWRNNTI